MKIHTTRYFVALAIEELTIHRCTPCYVWDNSEGVYSYNTLFYNVGDKTTKIHKCSIPIFLLSFSRKGATSGKPADKK